MKSLKLCLIILPLLILHPVHANQTEKQSKKLTQNQKKKNRNLAQAVAEEKKTTSLKLKDFLATPSCGAADRIEQKEIEKPLFKQLFLNQKFKSCTLESEKKQTLFTELTANLSKLNNFEKYIFQSEISDFKNQIALLTPEKKDDYETLIDKISHLGQSQDKERLLQQAITLATELKLEKDIPDLQKQLADNSPRLFPQEKDAFLVAKDLRLNRMFREAIEIYDQRINDPSETPDRIYQALKEKRQTFKMQQKRTEVLGVDAKIVPFVESQFTKTKSEKEAGNLKDTSALDSWRTRLINDTLISARALWTESRMSEGRQQAEQKMALLEPETNLDEFYFLFAKMAEEKKDFAQALGHYEKISKKSPVYLRTLWASGWIYLRQKKFSAAHKQFEELLTNTEENGEKIKALFWSAQALKKSKQTQLARQKFQEVEKIDPYGYYGILAHRELKLRFQPLTSTKLPSLQKIFNEVDSEKASTIQTLIDLKMRGYLEIGMRQFKEDIEKKIQTSKTTKSKKKKNTPKVAMGRDVSSDFEQDLRFGLIAAYSYAGLYLPLFQYMSSLPPAQKDAMLDQYPQILFPSDYYDLISSSAHKFKLDPALPLSIIRQESAFNPEARSHAEAYGLMQVLPSVAKQYQKRAKVSFKEPQELFIPEINVPIGCAFLSDLMRQWNQRFIPAVASYNSSARAVNNWLLTRTVKDPLMFIEEIPYEETRGYVKLVMRNHIMYQRITDQKSFSFPEKFLIL